MSKDAIARRGMWWDGGYAQLEAWGGCGWPLAFYTDVESPELPDSVFFFGRKRIGADDLEGISGILEFLDP